MKIKITFIGLIYSINAICQQVSTPVAPNTDPTITLSTPQKGGFAWFRGGNTNTGNNAFANNIFGTLWNSPIYTKTDNIQRQILMGTSPAGSITGAFGLGTISPQSFMHLSNFDNSLTSSGSGKLFLTDGLASNNNFVSIQGKYFKNLNIKYFCKFVKV